jgi:hypothetical protein
MSGRIKDAIVDFSAFSFFVSDGPHSVWFGEIISGVKLVRLLWSRRGRTT